MTAHIALDGIRQIRAVRWVVALILYELVLEREWEIPELRHVRYSPSHAGGLELARVKRIRRQDRREQSLNLVGLAGDQRQTFGKSFGHDITSPRSLGRRAVLPEAQRQA